MAVLAQVVMMGGAEAGSDMPDGRGATLVDVLQRINLAANATSYDGIYLHVQDDEIETVRVVRRNTANGFSERVFALNGAPREVVRDQTQVWCYLPDEEIGVHEYRQGNNKEFPRILPNDGAGLEPVINTHYAYHVSNADRVADRSAQMLYIMPKDDARYGYRLWIDERTNLLLRSDLVEISGKRMRVLEQRMFVTLDTDSLISVSALAPRTPKSQLTWFGSSDNGDVASQLDDQSQELTPQNWRADDLPSGFVQTESMIGRSPMTAAIRQHVAYSDGLALVSVFIEKQSDSGGGAPESSHLDGASRMGAVHAFGLVQGEYHITAMGEVPLGTVRRIAESMRLN